MSEHPLWIIILLALLLLFDIACLLAVLPVLRPSIRMWAGEGEREVNPKSVHSALGSQCSWKNRWGQGLTLDCTLGQGKRDSGPSFSACHHNGQCPLPELLKMSDAIFISVEFLTMLSSFFPFNKPWWEWILGCQYLSLVPWIYSVLQSPDISCAWSFWLSNILRSFLDSFYSCVYLVCKV